MSYGEMELTFVTISVCLCLVTGVSGGVEINFQNPEDGYMLKPLYHKHANKSQFLHSESFVVLQKDQDTHLLHAKFGAFEIYQTVPKMLLNHDNEGFLTSRTHHSVIDNIDLSVKILDYPTGQAGTRLRVLFHIFVNQVHDHAKSFGYFGQRQLWCARIYVAHNRHKISSQCVLSDSEESCIAELVPPGAWWLNHQANMDVSYSVIQTDSAHTCTNVGGVSAPDAQQAFLHHGAASHFLTKIAISNQSDTYMELRDHFVVINVPQKTLSPGSTLFVPIKLEAGSDLKMFIVRVRARSGIKILGAEVIKGNNWEIHVDVNDRQRSATITANIRDIKKYGRLKKSGNILRVMLEVESDITDSTKVCRVIWSVDRGYNTRSRSRYFLPESKMVSRFRINVSSPEKIVALLSVNDVLNTALLTGQEARHRLRVYLVSDDSMLRDITNISMCYSSDVHAIKVSSDCSHVFVDGSEIHGAYNISIIVKFGGHTAFASLNVWVPERRLDVQLSDNKLSQVKRWRISSLPRGYTPKTQPTNHQCHLKYQESQVTVYTRFQIDQGTRRLFYADKKAFFRVTDLVRRRIRVADARIAEIRSGVVYGKQPGRTEIQVLSPYGRVLGAREMRVVKDRVSVERITATLVTGISMEIMESTSIRDAMEAVVTLDDTIRDKLQEGIVNVEVHYSDKKVVPLRLIDSAWYTLSLTPTNPNLLYVSSGSQPRVTGLTSAYGKLIKYDLGVAPACRRKVIRSLAAGAIRVNIRLRSDRPPKKNIQSDAEYNLDYSAKFKYGREELLTVTLPEHEGFLVGDALGGDVSDGVTLKQPVAALQEQFTAVRRSVTPLETGMYVLLAIFCVAITVFVVHCGVFVYRNTRRKRLPKEASPVAANDWVWLGRATLERNSIMATRCSQALMPDEDFNGNRISRTSRVFEAESAGGGASSASSSNRNSQISTYRGHECSIRITANPIDDERPVSDNLSDVSTGSSYLSPTRRSFHFPDRDTLMSMSETDHEWDYEAMGMTYDQLVDYFGNLKETCA